MIHPILAEFIKAALAMLAVYFGVTAIMAYAVGFFVGVNRISWTPEATPSKGADRWFAWWARFGIKRGLRQ